MVRIVLASLAVLVFSLVACGGSSSSSSTGGSSGGGVNWTGNYAGPVSSAVSCSDGSNATQAGSSHFGLTQNGSQVSYQAVCGATVIADTNGNVATLRQVTCPPSTNDAGATTTLTITAGTFTLDGNSLAIDYSTKELLGGTATGNCTASITGTLARQ